MDPEDTRGPVNAGARLGVAQAPLVLNGTEELRCSCGEDPGRECPAVSLVAFERPVGGKLVEREGHRGAAAADEAADEVMG